MAAATQLTLTREGVKLEEAQRQQAVIQTRQAQTSPGLDTSQTTPTHPPPPGVPPDLRSPPLPYQHIATGTIQHVDWHWVKGQHKPLLDALGRATSAVSLRSYLSKRNESRASRRASPQRGGRLTIRHLWDLLCHGGHRAVAAPAYADTVGRCLLCHHPTYDLSHIRCSCPRTGQLRARAHLRSLLFRGATAPSRACQQVMLANVYCLFQQQPPEERGQLWLGHWPATLRQELIVSSRMDSQHSCR